ncbi:hypothetical protein [Paraburkholderia tuberum]|uniref:hypothetical protein n=1 Tax=Paraburkholderia tuberum TaxID=157910 RepID=UPI00159201BA|nr:hypothetical protein [Paraburkholderia tuberum]
MKWPFSDEPVKNRKFSIIREDGSVISGATNAAGKTSLQQAMFAENVRLRIDGESSA